MENKYMFCRLLGEIYRLQKRVDPEMCKVTDATIYGLIEGIEYVVDEEMQIEVISKNEVDIVGKILNQYWGDKEKLKQFT